MRQMDHLPGPTDASQRAELVPIRPASGLLRDRDVQLALGAIFAVIKGAGRALRESRDETRGSSSAERADRGSP